MEKSASGLQRGFFVVSFDGDVSEIEFVPVKVCDWRLIEYDAHGKSSADVKNRLLEIAADAEVANRVVLLKVSGEMVSGRTSDIDFVEIRRRMRERGALEILLNYNALSSKEYMVQSVVTDSPHLIEEKLFRERLSEAKFGQKRLAGETGVATSKEILRVLKDEKMEDEVKDDYDSRLLKGVVSTLDLDAEFK